MCSDGRERPSMKKFSSDETKKIGDGKDMLQTYSERVKGEV